MVEIIKRVRKDVNFKDLNMRIGIHTVFRLLILGLILWWNYWDRHR